jgi:hypothetical protein
MIFSTSTKVRVAIAQLYLVFHGVVCVITALLCTRLAALPPLVLIFLCSVVGGGARVDKAVDRIVHVT